MVVGYAAVGRGEKLRQCCLLVRGARSYKVSQAQMPDRACSGGLRMVEGGFGPKKMTRLPVQPAELEQGNS